MATADVTHLVWLDFETTGLRDEDSVLEIGAVMTDLNLQQVGEPLSIVRNLASVLNVSLWDPLVVKMHTANGLLVDAAESEVRLSVKGLDDALESWACRVLDVWPAPGTLMLAGAGVSHYDHGVIKQDFPIFASMLHYATLDVSVLNRWFEIVSPYSHQGMPQKRDKHRALDDVCDALVLARWLQQYLVLDYPRSQVPEHTTVSPLLDTAGSLTPKVKA